MRGSRVRRHPHRPEPPAETQHPGACARTAGPALSRPEPVADRERPRRGRPAPPSRAKLLARSPDVERSSAPPAPSAGATAREWDAVGPRRRARSGRSDRDRAETSRFEGRQQYEGTWPTWASSRETRRPTALRASASGATQLGRILRSSVSASLQKGLVRAAASTAPRRSDQAGRRRCAPCGSRAEDAPPPRHDRARWRGPPSRWPDSR